jgi:hypothetical protein
MFGFGFDWFWPRVAWRRWDKQSALQILDQWRSPNWKPKSTRPRKIPQNFLETTLTKGPNLTADPTAASSSPPSNLRWYPWSPKPPLHVVVTYTTAPWRGSLEHIGAPWSGRGVTASIVVVRIWGRNSCPCTTSAAPASRTALMLAGACGNSAPACARRCSPAMLLQLTNPKITGSAGTDAVERIDGRAWLRNPHMCRWCGQPGRCCRHRSSPAACRSLHGNRGRIRMEWT